MKNQLILANAKFTSLTDHGFAVPQIRIFSVCIALTTFIQFLSAQSVKKKGTLGGLVFVVLIFEGICYLSNRGLVFSGNTCIGWKYILNFMVCAVNLRKKYIM